VAVADHGQHAAETHDPDRLVRGGAGEIHQKRRKRQPALEDIEKGDEKAEFHAEDPEHVPGILRRPFPGFQHGFPAEEPREEIAHRDRADEIHREEVIGELLCHGLASSSFFIALEMNRTVASGEVRKVS